MSELRQKLEAVGWKHIGDSKMFPELYEFHKKFAVTDWVEHYEYPYIELATHANLLDGDDDWSNWGDKEEVEAISLNDSKGLSLSGGLNSVDMYYLRQAMIEAYAEMKVNRETLNRLAVRIAQIARGNAYISQDDIRRMMDEILDK